MLMDTLLCKGGRADQRTTLGCDVVPMKASASTPIPPWGTSGTDVPSELSQVGWELDLHTAHGSISGCGLPQEGDVTLGEAVFFSESSERTARWRISLSSLKRD